MRTRRVPSVRRDRAEVWRALRLLGAMAVRNEERIRKATAATEESRKAEAEAREARRTEDEARRKADAEEREARRTEDEARRKAEAEEREARRAEDEARRKAEAEALEARRAEDEARRQADAEERDARRQAEAEAIEARRKAEAEALEVRRAEDEARRQAEAKALEARQREEEKAREARQQAEEKARETHRLDDLERKRRFDAMIVEGIRKGDEAFDARHQKIEAALHRLIGDGDQRWGRLMEALAEGDLPGILRGIGIEVAGLRHRAGATMNGRKREWDLIADGPEATVVVEVKTTLRPEDVRHFRERMDTFRQWMPDYDRSGKRIHGALAYLSAGEAVLTNAERRGFLLIRVVGSSASLRNSDGFVPVRF